MKRPARRGAGSVSNLPGDEGAPARHHDGLLAVDVLLLERVDDVLLLEALERERERAVVRALDELDAPEPADAERGHHVEVGEPDLRVLRHRRRLVIPRATAHRARAGRPAARVVVVRLRPQLAQVADQLDERAGNVNKQRSISVPLAVCQRATATKCARHCSPFFRDQTSPNRVGNSLSRIEKGVGLPGRGQNGR